MVVALRREQKWLTGKANLCPVRHSSGVAASVTASGGCC